MKIVIIGAGALGSLFGGLLARSGHSVSLYNPSNLEHIQTIRKSGLVIETNEGEQRVSLSATSQASELERSDLVAIFVKAHHTAKAIQETHSLLQRAPLVMSLQNGFGVETEILGIVPRENFLRGTTSQGATLLAPGRVRWAGKGVTHLGRWQGQPTPAVQSIVDALNQSSLETHAAGNVIELVWIKLIVNSAINALTALFDVPNGVLLKDPGLREILRAITRESVAVARAYGFAFSESEMIARVEQVCQQTAENISSMLQDVRRKRPTEIEFINGAIALEGKRLGVSTPLNQLLLRLVQK
ncbi:2-dehydropantoate 2-reductase [Candidatus Acetothermia bacterium]|nr:2-dehydropantoate 2-reductase [Candidatus Acetothermia bacterium]